MGWKPETYRRRSAERLIRAIEVVQRKCPVLHACECERTTTRLSRCDLRHAVHIAANDYGSRGSSLFRYPPKWDPPATPEEGPLGMAVGYAEWVGSDRTEPGEPIGYIAAWEWTRESERRLEEIIAAHQPKRSASRRKRAAG